MHEFWAIKSSFAAIRNRGDQKQLQRFISNIWGNSRYLNSLKVLPSSTVETHHSILCGGREWVCAVVDDITSLQPWFWGTAVHCGLRWLERRLCSEQSRGTPWLAVWTAPPDTGTGHSDFAPLKQKRTRTFKKTKQKTTSRKSAKLWLENIFSLSMLLWKC